MQLSSDEMRALAFIAGLIGLSVLGRWVDRPRAVLPDVQPVDIAELERRSRAELREGEGGRGGGGGVGGQGVDLNTAGVGELERLPGIGPALAGRIVAYRDSVGGFRSLDQLDSVKGVGPVLLGRLKPLLRLRE